MKELTKIKAGQLTHPCLFDTSHITAVLSKAAGLDSLSIYFIYMGPRASC